MAAQFNVELAKKLVASLAISSVAAYAFWVYCTRPRQHVSIADYPNDQGVCSICWDIIQRLSVIRTDRQKNPTVLEYGHQKQLPCGHKFHTTCIRKWIVDRRNGTCPVCDAPCC